MKKSFWLIAPFATWMVLMTVLPATTWAYAVRTKAVAFLLLCACVPYYEKVFRTDIVRRSLLPGLLVGLAVFAIWILPEQFDWAWYRRFCIVGEGGTKAVADTDMDKVVSMMVGREMQYHQKTKCYIKTGAPVLEAEHIAWGDRVRDVSFALHKGEILGMFGIVGAGRTETARAIFGMDPKESGDIYIDGEKVEINQPLDAIKAGKAPLEAYESNVKTYGITATACRRNQKR